MYYLEVNTDYEGWHIENTGSLEYLLVYATTIPSWKGWRIIQVVEESS